MRMPGRWRHQGSPDLRHLPEPNPSFDLCGVCGELERLEAVDIAGAEHWVCQSCKERISR